MAITLNGTTGITTPALDTSGDVGVGTVTPNRTLHVVSSQWDNESGGGAIFENSNAVGSGITLKPTASAVNTNGWAIYAGAAGSNVGDGNIGIWSHKTGAPGLKFKVSQDGQVTAPLQPSFFAYHNSGDINYVPSQTLPYQSTRHNTGNHYNTSTSTFTAPIAGTYMFSATVNANADSANTTVPRAYWQVNGGNIGYNVHFRGSDSLTEGLDQLSATVVFQLSANDTVRIQVQQGRFDLFGANHFCGHLLS